MFRNGNQWAIAIERLGYSPRGGRVDLDIHYYGNCLHNLEIHNEQSSNYYSVSPIQFDQFLETVEGEVIQKDAEYWVVRGEQVKLNHNKNDYLSAGIELMEYEPNEIRIEEAVRLLITKHGALFRATDDELYKSIPKDLKKVLVLDEWHHKDFYMQNHEPLTENQLRKAYELNKKASSAYNNMSYDEFVALSRRQEEINKQADHEEWLNNRPSTYETWQQIAKVIETGDVSYYKPTLEPNTHWKNYPESGSL